MKSIKTSAFLFCLAAALFLQEARANTQPQASPIRNVIVMIPDGCSTELLALGRWMNHGIPLALDSRIRGLVRTYCSDSPIGDSA
ncbi:MAG: alkaline phosphatase, partial [Bacteroidales bacterium]|nr:alkaline phosphatase [Bacteroidales bacterium]